MHGLTTRLYSFNHLVALCLGGPRGFNKVIWTVKEHVQYGDSPYITYYRSFDGEQGKTKTNTITHVKTL